MTAAAATGTAGAGDGVGDGAGTAAAGGSGGGAGAGDATRSLAAGVDEESLEAGTWPRILLACETAAWADADLALAALPYALACVASLPNADGAVSAEIRGEMVEVLTSAAGVPPDADESQLTAVPLGSSFRRVDADVARCAHVVFGVMDTLTAWEKANAVRMATAPRRRKSSSSSSSSSSPSSPKGMSALLGDGKRVAALVRTVPRNLLALAAHRVGAAPRALLYFESYLRARYAGPFRNGILDPLVERRVKAHIGRSEPATDGGSAAAVGGLVFGEVPYTRAELALLQQLCAATGDPDTIHGVTALRAKRLFAGPDGSATSSAAAAESTEAKTAGGRGGEGGARESLREQLLDAEHDGRWPDALVSYEALAAAGSADHAAEGLGLGPTGTVWGANGGAGATGSGVADGGGDAAAGSERARSRAGAGPSKRPRRSAGRAGAGARAGGVQASRGGGGNDVDDVDDNDNDDDDDDDDDGDCAESDDDGGDDSGSGRYDAGESGASADADDSRPAPHSGVDAAATASQLAEQAALQAGLVRCLQRTGHIETSLVRARGVIAAEPALAPALAPLACDAAWQLGQWGALVELLNGSAGGEARNRMGEADTGAAPSAEPFEASMGRVMLELHRVETAARDAARAAATFVKPGRAAVSATGPHSGTASRSGSDAAVTRLGQWGDALAGSDQLRLRNGSMEFADRGARGGRETGGSCRPAVSRKLLRLLRSQSLAEAGRLPAGWRGPFAHTTVGAAAAILPGSATSSIAWALPPPRGMWRLEGWQRALLATGAASGGVASLAAGHGHGHMWRHGAAGGRALLDAGAASASVSDGAGGWSSAALHGGFLHEPAALAGSSAGSSAGAALAGASRSLAGALRAARSSAVRSLAAASSDGYTRAYAHAVRLHALADVEEAAAAVEAAAASGRGEWSGERQALVSRWSPGGRLDITQPSMEAREPVLAARRSVARVLGLRSAEAASWTELARLARGAGSFEVASTALLRAKALGDASAGVESARLLRAQGRVRAALAEIEPVVRDSRAVEAAAAGMTEAEQLEEGRRVLLATGWQLDAQCADRTVAARFRLAIKLGQQWEEGIYRLGRYFDSVLQSLMVAVSAGDLQSSVLESRDKHVTLVVQHFCRGLRAARSQARHVYEMLPRVLTLVLDYGAACEREARSGSASRTSSASSTAAAAAAAGGGASVGAVLASDPQSVYAKPSEECLQRLLDRLEGLLATMTANRWLTALPQLTSRICHRHGRVAGFIQRTLQLVSLLFPRQSHWSIVSLSRSTVRLRAERAHQVLDLIRGSAGLPGHQAQVGLYNSTVKALVACARSTTAADSKQLNISWSVSRRAFDSAGANGVLIPNLRQLTVSVPEAPDPLDGGRGWGGVEGGAAAAGAVSNAGAGSSAGGASAAAAGSPMGSAPGGTGATAGTQGIAGSGDEAEALAEGEVAAAAALVINGGRVDQLAPGSLSLSGFGEPDSQVLVAELEPTVAVMSSKEQPKRVTAMGTDGRRHPFLCKTERRGDLRKDARVMEFATTVNRLLRRDAEGRRRALALRAYAVVVLSEDTGLAEWVQGTSTFRAEVTKVYAANKLKDPMVVVTETYKTYQKEQDMFAHDKKTMATRFRFRWLPLFPALFHQWFPLTFAGPAEWLASRTEFARSAAAWSITGHIIGLGDRHGENLLIDTRSGACVHVDFDCIFDKGLKLRRAEVVPFRLTGNMLDGMGLAGHEGTFRRTAEACLRVFRSERDVLLSVLEPFVHDPLVEWNRKSKRGSDSGGGRGSDRVGSDGGMLPLTGVGGETVQMEGLEVMRRTAERIAGFYNYGHTAGEVALASGRAAGNPGAGGTPLSVEGQAHRLIAEATSHENLCRLYVGWLPWL